jgi:Ni/Co efflux regulator RcnB
MHRPSRLIVVVAAASLAACTVAPGPVEQQATQASIACQQGYQQACTDAAYLQQAASAERAQAQPDANVGTAVAAGVVGLAAGAAIVGSSGRHYRGRSYYGRGHHYRRGHHYGRGHYRRW